MRALLRGIAVLSLFAAGSASASEDVFVRWTRLEPTVGDQTNPSSTIGPLAGTTDQFISPSSRWRTVGGGSAMLNLKNGFLSFRLEALANGFATPASPMGSPLPSSPTVKGTVVCYSTRPGSVVFVDTPTVTLDDGGTGSFEGFLSLPWECADAPREIAFLIRHDTPTRPGIDGLYMVYGAGRAISP